MSRVELRDAPRKGENLVYDDKILLYLVALIFEDDNCWRCLGFEKFIFIILEVIL